MKTRIQQLTYSTTRFVMYEVIQAAPKAVVQPEGEKLWRGSVVRLCGSSRRVRRTGWDPDRAEVLEDRPSVKRVQLIDIYPDGVPQIVLVRMLTDGVEPSTERFRYVYVLDRLFRTDREEGVRSPYRGLEPNAMWCVVMVGRVLGQCIQRT